MKNLKFAVMLLMVVLFSNNLYAVRNPGFSKLTHQKALDLVEDLRDENPVMHRHTSKCPYCKQEGMKVTSYLVVGSLDWPSRYECVAICRNCNKLVITDMICSDYVDGHPEYKQNGYGQCTKELYNGKYRIR